MVSERGKKRQDRGATRVLGYVRVSTEGQEKHGYGLEAQREAIQRFCTSRRWKLIRIFEDPGVSGATADEEDLAVNRPGLQEMLASINGHHIQFIVVLNTSRLWRSDLAKAIIQSQLRKLDVDVKSIEQPAYSIKKQEPSEYLVNSLLEALDVYQRLEIAVKLRRGRLVKAKQGGYAGGQPPFGYRAMRGTKILQIDENEAKIVRQIFELQARDMSANAIAKLLNEDGIRTREGGIWTHRQILRILSRRASYTGKTYRYGDVEARAQHQPILTE